MRWSRRWAGLRRLRKVGTWQDIASRRDSWSKENER